MNTKPFGLCCLSLAVALVAAPSAQASERERDHQASFSPSAESIGLADDAQAGLELRNVPTPGAEDLGGGGIENAPAIPACGASIPYTFSAGTSCGAATNCFQFSTTGVPRPFADGVAGACPGRNCSGNFATAATIPNLLYYFDAADCQCITVSLTQAAGQAACTTMAGIGNVAFAGHVTPWTTGYPANCLPSGATRYGGSRDARLISGTTGHSFCLQPGETTFTVALHTGSAAPTLGTCAGTLSVACADCTALALQCEVLPVLEAIELKLDSLVGPSSSTP